MATELETKAEPDSALADLTERAFESTQSIADAQKWLAVRGLKRSGDIAHQNWKDTRRLLGREKDGKEAMDEEMRVNSPETHHHYPQPVSAATSLAKPLINLALAAVLGGSGIGAAYFIADAIKSRPVSEDTDSTLLQQFGNQDEGWIND